MSVAILSFVVFLYFKVTLDAAFDSNVSVQASLLMAIIWGLLVVLISRVYATVLVSYRTSAVSRVIQFGRSVRRTVVPFILVSAVFTIVSRLVVFGFSKGLSYDLSFYAGYSSGKFNEDVFLFSSIILLPFIIHYVATIIKNIGAKIC